MLQPNIAQALETMVDVPEATTVTLLKAVATHHLAAPVVDADSAMTTDSLPYPPPSLLAFLPSFLLAPHTPALLRQAIQSQLSAVEVLPILEVCDSWLGWWMEHGGGGGDMEEEKDAEIEEGKKGGKRLAKNPFLALGDEDREAAPPQVELVRSFSHR